MKKKAKKEELQTVWTLFYSHRHGNDITVYDTENAAKKSALEIVESYKDDYDPDPSEYKTPEDMLNNWWEITSGEEGLEISGHQVIKEEIPNSVQFIKDNLKRPLSRNPKSKVNKVK
jgi:hypothetical protein